MASMSSYPRMSILQNAQLVPVPRIYG
ncbi:hypothetical protein Goari_000146 [Gossypium aridum]|uniref:Uncharacterized protein n=1 Tax=Gossypium aridum TaxID=34290 RepID=A0A7J8YHC1_GOSAI|nr:hypothetical protein [Gossypium aridum]